MKWIKKKKVKIDIKSKRFEIGKVYKFEPINRRDINNLKIHNEARCIKLYENYALFQFQNYLESFLYTDDRYIITEVV